MSLERYKDFSSLVSPERVHKAVIQTRGFLSKNLTRYSINHGFT